MIYHIIYSLQTGGAETLLVDLINEQVKVKPVTLVIINSNFNILLLDTISSKVKIITLNRKAGSVFNLKPIFKLWSNLLFNQPCVIHCHNHNIIPLIFPWKKKAVLTVHDVNINSKYFNLYNKLFSISNAVYQDLLVRFNIESIVIYNGIYLKEYQNKVDYSFTSNQPFNIIQVSRLMHTKKGQDIALRAIAEIYNNYPNNDINIYFAGEGESLDYLKSLSKQLGLESKVHFLGRVTRNWVKNNLKNFHLLIQPSLYEGFGLTVIEGLASGLPVIASNLDGPREILNIVGAGHIIDISNPKYLSEKIVQVKNMYLSNSIEYDRTMNVEISKLHMFDITTMANKYLEFYQK